MLSYKHGFHAGNHADVLKHIVLIYLYNLSKKHCKSMTYIDTHSGNGIYKCKHLLLSASPISLLLLLVKITNGFTCAFLIPNSGIET